MALHSNRSSPRQYREAAVSTAPAPSSTRAITLTPLYATRHLTSARPERVGRRVMRLQGFYGGIRTRARNTAPTHSGGTMHAHLVPASLAQAQRVCCAPSSAACARQCDRQVTALPDYAPRRSDALPAQPRAELLIFAERRRVGYFLILEFLGGGPPCSAINHLPPHRRC